VILLVVGLLAYSGLPVHSTTGSASAWAKAFVESVRRRTETPGSDRPNLALTPALLPYVHDQDPRVREALADWAGGVPCAASVQILSYLIDDPDDTVADYACFYLYGACTGRREYSMLTVKRDGGQVLRDALLRVVWKEPSAECALLCACFTGDPTVVRALQRTRVQIGTESTMLPGSHFEAQYGTVLDIALAELGQRDAGDRLVAVLKTGNISSVDICLRAGWFVRDTDVLRAMSELIKDKRPLGHGATSYGWDPHRVCDDAVWVLARQTDVILPFRTFQPLDCFTDAQLAEAYTKVRARLSAR
jgi:hypothetical protein